MFVVRYWEEPNVITHFLRHPGLFIVIPGLTPLLSGIKMLSDSERKVNQGVG
jgi:hypothetical protein